MYKTPELGDRKKELTTDCGVGLGKVQSSYKLKLDIL